ncbi:MAG: NUDIX hydrolase [Pseudomonadota bacterium]
MQPLERDGIRLAATVMLVRDTGVNQAGEGLEVYMVQRPGRGAFPDLHVFPGGKVDEADWSPDLCAGIDDQSASARLGLAAGGLRYWVAVARECFEESGVLLARRNGVRLTFDQVEMQHRFAHIREQLLNDEITFADVCHAEQLTIDCDRLAYFSHWITPEMAPRRFDTRFFVAAMPPDQATLAHVGEATDEQWITPAQALAKHRDAHWQMIDPTLRSLETLSQFRNVDDALAGINAGNHLMPLTPELNRQGMQALR